MEIARTLVVCTSLAVSASLFFAIPMGLIAGIENLVKGKKRNEEN